MRSSLPIRQDSINLLLIDAISRKLKFGTDEQVVRDGLPVWEAPCLLQQPGARPEVVVISFTSEKQPSVQVMTPVRFTDLAVRYWENGANSGVTLSATGIDVPATAPASPPAAKTAA